MFPLLLILSGFSSGAFASELKVSFEDMRNDSGKILFLIFKSENGFPDDPDKSIYQGELTVSEARNGLSIKLDDGDYAMTLIHDENDNGELDKSFLGVPTEGFGFSNNPQILFGPPSFEKASFKLKGLKKIKLKVKYF